MMMQGFLDTTQVQKRATLSPLLMTTISPTLDNYFLPTGGGCDESQIDLDHDTTQSERDLLFDVPLLQIKLHRPHVASTLVERPQLYAKLNSGQDASLTLISAPAGYGKTTLLASWLERQDLPGAWLSLDRGDNNLVTFLTYLVAAVRTIFPEACPQTASALVNSQLSMAWSAATLANELDRLPSRMALVVDEIHMLDNQAVIQFLTLLLRYPLKGLHLVLIGRKDPFLPLARLRAQGQLTEIRASDLRFSYEEAATYLGRVVAVDLSPSVIASLEKQTEGWITGLRLAALSITSVEDADALMQRIRLGTRYVMDYLVEEVIARQEPAIREYLLMASLADRFCASLLDAMSEPRAALPWNGRSFLEWLARADLFVVPLDEIGDWYRFHLLFQQLLRHLVQAHFGSREVAACHLRISAWYAQQGMIHEALHHALAGGDQGAAIQLVEEHLSDVLNHEDGPALAQWLAQLPEHLIHQHPALVLARAYSLSMQWRPTAIIPCVERAENLLENKAVALSVQTMRSLRCGINMLKSQDAYWRGDASGCRIYAQEALADASADESFVRGNAMLYLALARQRLGEGEVVIQQLELTIAKSSDPPDAYTHWLHLALACLYHYQGDLTRVIEVASFLVRSASVTQQRIILGWAHYLLGAAWYQRNQLEEARYHYAAASQLRNHATLRVVHASLHGQAAICLAQASLDEADELAHAARELADDNASPELIADSRAFMALLALTHGEVAQAGQLVPASNAGADALALWSVTPTLTRTRMVLANATDPLLHEAEAELESLLQLTESIHNTRQVIALLVLQTLVLQALERPRAGLGCLQRAIELAEPRGFRRVFIDEGVVLVPLLQELARKGVAPIFISYLLTAIPEPEAMRPAQLRAELRPANLELVEALTYRELDVLELLAQRLSNQEIAEKLIISPATARTHLTNIYQKLQVGSRRQAVLRAREIGVL